MALGRRWVIDGIGADTVYAGGYKLARWQRLYRTPNWLMNLAGQAHRLCWLNPGRTEYLSRIARRIGHLPMTLGPWLAQNALDGIVYASNHALRETLANEYREWLLEVAENASVPQEIALTLLSPHCTDLYCSKLDPRLSGSPYQPAHPFLSQRSIDIALQFSQAWPTQPVPKARLKELLARHIDPKLVYRKKQGFVPPIRSAFALPALKPWFDALLDSRHPCFRYLQRRPLERLVTRARQNQPLASPVEYFLWNLLFSTAWLEHRPCLMAEPQRVAAPVAREAVRVRHDDRA
jgi:hypothetical protein